MTKRHFKTVIFTAAAVMIWCGTNFAQSRISLSRQFAEISRASKGTVGAAVMDLSSGKTFVFNENGKFPMQSVYKLPLAMMVLDQVNKGRFSLDQKIFVSKKDLLPDTWSPLRDKYPQGDVAVPLAEIIGFTVAQSDNNGCDILFRLVGGTAAVQRYVKNLGVKDMAIAATEEEMARSWDVQFTNWCKPAAMLKLLKILNRGDRLSKSSTEFLQKTMLETTTGPNRIKGLLPAGTPVAHKTGTSGKNRQGVTGAINDAGIVTLPGGKKYAVAVFVVNSPDDAQVSEAVIARIAQAAWNYLQ